MTGQTDLDTAQKIVQLVCFKLAQEEYAVDITNVQEVIRIQKITPAPQMPQFVLGVINIRGNIVPVFDLRKLFHLREKPFDELTKILVLDIGGTMISVIVDEILDNLKIAASQIDPAPSVQLKISRECIRGLGQVGNRLLIILDMEQISGVIDSEIDK